MGHVFVLFFTVYGFMLCLVRYLFVISTTVIGCLGRFIPEVTYYVSSGTLNLADYNYSGLQTFVYINCTL